MIDITENIIPIPPTATALGFFDGLHLGHMKVVEECFGHGGLCPAMFMFHSDAALLPPPAPSLKSNPHTTTFAFIIFTRTFSMKSLAV